MLAAERGVDVRFIERVGIAADHVLDFFADDLDETEALLRQLGATTPDYQPHREDGLVVMLDPAGHPFCIGTRIEIDD